MKGKLRLDLAQQLYPSKKEKRVRPKDWREMDTYHRECKESMRAVLDKHGVGEVPCGFTVGKGWIPIVDHALGKLVNAGWDRKLGQVKQKFCQLRIYLDGAWTEQMRDIVHEAGYQADQVCEVCGNVREKKGMGTGWALCNACSSDREAT